MGRRQVRSQVEWELEKQHNVAAGGLEAVQARVRAARLSEVQMLCLTMLWYHDLRQEELSVRLRISQQAISAHIRRGLERLRAAGLSRRRRRRYVLPQMLQATPGWLDQLAPEDIRVGW
jgi:DNA-binding MarR family transcriptional regulator